MWVCGIFLSMFFKAIFTPLRFHLLTVKVQLHEVKLSLCDVVMFLQCQLRGSHATAHYIPTSHLSSLLSEFFTLPSFNTTLQCLTRCTEHFFASLMLSTFIVLFSFVNTCM